MTETKTQNIEFVISLSIALIVAILYRALLKIDSVSIFLGRIALRFDSVIIIFIMPFIISGSVFYLYSKNVMKAIIVGIMTVLLFFVILFLTLTSLPGIP